MSRTSPKMGGMLATDTATDPSGEAERAPRRRRLRLRRVIAALLGASLVLAVVGTLLVWNLYRQLDRVDVDLSSLPDRPAPGSGVAAGALNVGLLGTADGHLTSLMVLHVDADRRGARFLSVPYPSLDGGTGRPTAVSARPSGEQVRELARVLESETGLRLDHVAVFDWHLVSRLVDRLGGVDVHLDPVDADAIWTEYLRVTGDLVPEFVTSRGTTDTPHVRAELRRVHRQQRLLDTVAEQTLHQELVLNPIGLYRVLHTLTSHLVVDDDWSARDMARLVVSLRHLRSGDIGYETTPYPG